MGLEPPTLFSASEPPKRTYDFAAANAARDADKHKEQPAPTAKETLTSLVLAELSLGRGSDRQIAERLADRGLPRASESVRKRRLELEQQGYVRFSGEFVINRLDNQERVYEITHAGRLRSGAVAA